MLARPKQVRTAKALTKYTKRQEMLRDIKGLNAEKNRLREALIENGVSASQVVPQISLQKLRELAGDMGLKVGG